MIGWRFVVVLLAMTLGVWILSLVVAQWATQYARGVRPLVSIRTVNRLNDLATAASYAVAIVFGLALLWFAVAFTVASTVGRR